MYYYLLYGMLIESDIEFPQLVQGEPGDADLKIQKGKMPQEIYDIADPWSWRYDKEKSWFTNSFCYLYFENGNCLTYEIRDEGTEMLLRAYILGWGMAIIGLQRGMVAIHCSVVASEQGAILIAGGSGSGKSTLTNTFLDHDWRFMADDMAYVKAKEDGEVVVYPAFPWQKLCRDVALRKGYNLEELIYIDEEKDKFLVPYEGEFHVGEMPVKALLVLRRKDIPGVEVREYDGMNKFFACVDNMFLKQLLGQDIFKSVPGQESFNIAMGIRVFTITRPSDGDTLEAVTENAMKIAKEVM